VSANCSYRLTDLPKLCMNTAILYIILENVATRIRVPTHSLRNHAISSLSIVKVKLATFQTSTRDWGVWLASYLGPLLSRKSPPYTRYGKFCGLQSRSACGAEQELSTRASKPGCAARSQSLYRLEVSPFAYSNPEHVCISCHVSQKTYCKVSSPCGS
jgi:hypothetical protein